MINCSFTYINPNNGLNYWLDGHFNLLLLLPYFAVILFVIVYNLYSKLKDSFPRRNLIDTATHKNLNAKQNAFNALNPKKVKTQIIKDQLFIQKCEEAIIKEISNPDLNVDLLAENVGVSRSKLYRALKQNMQIPPTEFIYSIRLKNAKKLLSSKEYTISEIAKACGFSSSNSFSQVFKKKYGKSPSDFLAD